jgi:hypothetical protein
MPRLRRLLRGDMAVRRDAKTLAAPAHNRAIDLGASAHRHARNAPRTKPLAVRGVRQAVPDAANARGSDPVAAKPVRLLDSPERRTVWPGMSDLLRGSMHRHCSARTLSADVRPAEQAWFAYGNDSSILTDFGPITTGQRSLVR